MDYNSFVPDSTIVVNQANYFMTVPGRSSWGPRVIPDFEIIYQVEGRGLYKEKGKATVEMNEDEILLIPPGTEHTFSCPEGTTNVISCIHFQPSANGGGDVSAATFNAAAAPEIHRLFRKCADFYDWETPCGKRLLGFIVAEIWVLISALESPHASPAPVKLTLAKDYARAHFREQISRRDIAGFLDVTPEYLNSLFRRHLKTTPLAYIQAFRMQEAKELLRTTPMSVSEIARATGFQDPLYFSRVFKKATGISPSAFGKSI
jgi:AraC family transcriptional regulator, arabinose operon regulatory protein